MFKICLHSPGTQYSVIQSSKFELNPTQKPSTKNRTPGLHSSGYGIQNLQKNTSIFITHFITIYICFRSASPILALKFSSIQLAIETSQKGNLFFVMEIRVTWDTAKTA